MTTDRRSWLGRALAAAGAWTVGACDGAIKSPPVRSFLARGEVLTRRAQRALLNPRALAREYLSSDIAPSFRVNGSRDPPDPAYREHAANGFRDWRLAIDGLVDTPLSLSLEELRQASPRTQITRHDCVEGWSCIGKWTGARLAPLLDRASLKREAKFLIFHCADNWGDDTKAEKYYESIDLVDARHEQTILAYSLNDAPLPVANGAPIRLRVERQLGYKHAKFVMRIEAVRDLADIRGGKGGYWEDRGYEWYAGI